MTGLTGTGLGEAADATPASAARRGLAVLILVGLYVHMDRLVIGLQGEAIRQALALSDLQFGLIQGASVALFSAVVGYPVGWMADRFDPRRVLAGCLLVWGAAIAACGLAGSFETLFAVSALVGAAEAGLLPIAYALIPEWFHGRSRQRANAAFVFCGRLAVGLVILACAWLIRQIDSVRGLLPEALAAWPTWRLSLLATGLPSLLLALLVLGLPRANRVSAWSRETPMPQALGWLRSRLGVFGPTYAAAGAMALGASAVGSFVPMLAQRRWEVSADVAGNAMGLAALAGAAGALLFTVASARWVDAQGPARGPLRGALAGLTLAGLVTPFLAAAPSLPSFFVVYGLHLLGVMTAAMLLPTALASLSPGPLRARLLSIYVGAAVVLGAAGPALVGGGSDTGSATPAALGTAMAVVGAVALLTAAACLLGALRSLRAR